MRIDNWIKRDLNKVWDKCKMGVMVDLAREHKIWFNLLFERTKRERPAYSDAVISSFLKEKTGRT